MNVLLIHADFKREIKARDYLEGFCPPMLGINYLATILRQHGHKVVALDSLYQFFQSGLKSEINLYEGLEDIIKEEEIEVVGISVTSPTRLVALNLAEIIKKVNPKIKVIFGGPHASLIGEKILEKEKIIDYLILGEGEESLPALINALQVSSRLHEIAGLVFRENGKIIANPLRDPIQNLDFYPFPDYHQYTKITPDKRLTTASVITGRGCFFNCSYCGSKALWKGSPRLRSIDQVVKEIQYLKEEYKISKVLFNDDTFSYPLNRAKNLLRNLLDRNIRIKIGCSARFDCVDEEFFEYFKQVGGGFIYFGLESGSKRIRELMNKDIPSEEQIIEIANLTKKYNIRLGIHLIFGYPSETDEDIKQTDLLLDKIKPDEVTANIAHVHPGTKLFRESNYNVDDWLKRELDFFPYETSPEKIKQLRRICNFFEQRYSSHLDRAGFIRDLGSAEEVKYAG